MPTPPNKPRLLATAGTLEASTKQVAEFYGGEEKEIREAFEGRRRIWTVWSAAKYGGTQCTGVRILHKAGRYRFEML